ncbi:TRAP transporter substrate-binding protein [Thalassospira sp.]|uniref:TRAP transporter substrate-binding protein n=1 Tax=Thalassospira sp. TaxID=1912094 RepID=UPI0027352A76|nr:TRAP transporter substrate-binding protein [Thalassospira sp.]MDP2698649.1 TRAP transporter substrate-binding protein [Thalassospira sp.]
MFKKALSTAAIAAFTLSTSAAFAADKWDMATPYPDATFHTQNIIEFAKDVKEATNGDLEITVHSGGSLFKHPDIKRSVQRGLVPAGETLISLLANEDPIYNLDAIPFLATSYDQAQKLWQVSRPTIEAKLAAEGLKVLYAVAWPSQGLYTSKEVNSVTDLSGIRFRAYNSATSKLADLTGMVSTQVEVPEIPTAFATGIVEAMMTSPSTGANSKAWDFVSNFYDVQAWLPKNMVIVNAKAFDALSAETQQAVLDAAARAETRGWEMSVAETDAQKKVLADNGMTVAAPSADLKDGLSKVGETMVTDWLAEAGAEGQAIVDAFRQ